MAAKKNVNTEDRGYIKFFQVKQNQGCKFYTNTDKAPEKPISWNTPDYIFDEDQSVKWNREKVAQEEAAYNQAKQDYSKKTAELKCQLEYDLGEAILDYFTRLGMDVSNTNVSTIIEFVQEKEFSQDDYSYVDDKSPEMALINNVEDTVIMMAKALGFKK